MMLEATAATRRPLRVAHVVHGLEVGGLEKQVIETVRRADGRIVQPQIICTDYVGRLADDISRSTSVSAINARPGFDWRAILRLAVLLRRSRIDIIHSHNERSHFLSTLAGRLARIPVHINTRHGVYPPTTRRGAIRRRAMGRSSDLVVAVSRVARDVTVERDQIPSAKVRIINNGTDVNAPQLTRSEARRRLNLKNEFFVIGAAGRLAPEKDYATLIDAFAQAQADIPNVAGVILGDGELAGALAQAARTRGCQSLRFCGYRPDAASLLAGFDVFIQPSLTEGISNSVLEAMATGLPVIATAVDGNIEAIGDDGAGLLVPPRDARALATAIATLAREPEQRARLGAAARQRATAHFSIEATARAYEALYVELAHRKGLKI